VKPKRVYAFMSVKGGVGKTALSVATAAAWARHGKQVAFIDADFTGTSIADGLALQAPGLSRDQTLADRRARLLGTRGAPYLNDVLFGEVPFEPVAQAWTHPDVPGGWFYPSSAIEADVAKAMAGVFESDDITRRFREVVQSVAAELPVGGIVIVDLPPGMFSMAAISADALAAEDDLLFMPVLVMTGDNSDLARGVEVWRGLMGLFPRTTWLLNRDPLDDRVLAQLRGFATPSLASLDFRMHLREVGYVPALSRVFKTDRLELPEEEAEMLITALELRWLLSWRG
jgi:hypothetical protein